MYDLDDEREDDEDVNDDPEGGEAAADDEAVKPEGQGEEDTTPSGEDAPEEPDGDEESPESEGKLDPQIAELIKTVLSDEVGDIDKKVADGIAAREAAAAAERENEKRVQEMNELIERAEAGDEEAEIKLGRLTLQRIQQARVEAPIVERVHNKVAEEYNKKLYDALDATIDALGLSEAAGAVLAENPVALVRENFNGNDAEWIKAVVTKVTARAREMAKPSSENEKAERRRKTAERAAAGAGTPSLRGGRSKDDAASDGMSARDWLLGKD